MYKVEKKYYLKAFLIALIMGAVLLLPFVVIDGGYFIFYGDYNAQQIPFYKTCINAVQNGSFVQLLYAGQSVFLAGCSVSRGNIPIPDGTAYGA